MFYRIIDRDGRYKAWNGSWYFTPFLDDANVLKCSSHLELFFFCKIKEEGVLIYNDDGTPKRLDGDMTMKL